MYLKIETAYSSCILCVADIRNVSTGYDGNNWVVYIFYRCGTDSNTVIGCDSREERDAICEKIYHTLIKWESMLE